MEYDRVDKPKIADILIDLAEYDEEHPDSGFRIEPSWIREEMSIKLKEFFKSKTPE